jgi:hypothetical protein
MSRSVLLSTIVALVVAAGGAAAQPFAEDAARLAAAAEGLAARIRAFHGWQGLTPPPRGYCDTMQEGEAVQKQLARLASRATLFRRPGLALRLQAAGDRLSDELDAEEEINHQAEVPFDPYPCPVPPGPYPARAVVLRLVAPRAPECRLKANALGLSFGARRAMMQQCLRIPGT